MAAPRSDPRRGRGKQGEPVAAGVAARTEQRETRARLRTWKKMQTANAVQEQSRQNKIKMRQKRKGADGQYQCQLEVEECSWNRTKGRSRGARRRQRMVEDGDVRWRDGRRRVWVGLGRRRYERERTARQAGWLAGGWIVCVRAGVAWLAWVGLLFGASTGRETRVRGPPASTPTVDFGACAAVARLCYLWTG